MAPIKETVTLKDATSKGKAISIIGDMVPRPAIDQPRSTEDTGSSAPQGAASIN